MFYSLYWYVFLLTHTSYPSPPCSLRLNLSFRSGSASSSFGHLFDLSFASDRRILPSSPLLGDPSFHKHIAIAVRMMEPEPPTVASHIHSLP